MSISVFDGIENSVEKGENASCQHFLLFPQCFQKTYCQGRKKHGLLGKGKTNFQQPILTLYQKIMYFNDSQG